jgi:hypothetical protein
LQDCLEEDAIVDGKKRVYPPTKGMLSGHLHGCLVADDALDTICPINSQLASLMLHLDRDRQQLGKVYLALEEGPEPSWIFRIDLGMKR